MSAECYPITVLPHISELYRAYLAMAESAADAPVRRWYGGEPLSGRWMTGGAGWKGDASRLADALKTQSEGFGAGSATLANIERLRAGARAVVTGQQVGLFGGPLLTLLKAATAVARAKQATRATGVEHVPVFWLATEDHDLEEIDQVSLLTKDAVETLRTELKVAGPVPVGGIEIGQEIEATLARAEELLGYGPVGELLRECYAPRDGYKPTLGGAFARLMVRIFEAEGLVVMDAAGREFHSLGASTLRYAIEHAEELEEKLLMRTKELEAAGYHAQVLVTAGQSLLFMVDEQMGHRVALRRLADGGWKANGRTYSTAELLGILESAPERVSPNALLRPVFQDTILPTVAYVGGPAEIAYFAQSAVAYEMILGRITPVLPRLSATLIEPAIATVMEEHEISLGDVLAAKTTDELAQRLGARAMPIEEKRRLAAVGNAMEVELAALTEYMAGMDENLARAAEVSGSKMLYQMNRLRRMAATYELQRETSLKKHATAMMLNLFPEEHPQERLLAGVWFLARQGEGLVERLVTEAESLCPGHIVVRV
jgi:bacillithiol biosynthesis cysteine-adding enzyme BshC